VLGLVAIAVLPPPSVIAVTLVILVMFFTAVRPVAGVFVAGGIEAMIGYAQAIFGGRLNGVLPPLASHSVSGFWDPAQRVFGTLGDPVLFGLCLTVVALVAVAVLFHRNVHTDDAKRLTLFILALSPLLVLTYSRVVWFMFVVGFVILVVRATYAHRSRS
jgi:hypothetical protein